MGYRNIVHIDDDEDDQEIFLTAAKEASAYVTCNSLNDATEALQKLMVKALNPDVIFLDLNMPVMNGQQFLIEIKKHALLKSIPIIILSTSSHFTTIELMKELGAHDFITKPERYDELVNLLKPLLS